MRNASHCGISPVLWRIHCERDLPILPRSKLAQRAGAGFRSNPKARKVVPPPGEGCWRKVLGDVDPKELAKALNAWMQSQFVKDALA